MKYPQLVSMPEAVRSWLEEELEARGIDSVIYSRYIFSLLQQKTLDDLPIREQKRGRKRGHRDYALDLDQQRRSAAVECLMSASDQKSGIEALVDELCAKLKVIQSEASRPQELVTNTGLTCLQTILSSHDLESKYYAAFPPLISKDRPNTEVFTSQLSNSTFSVWSGKKFLGCSFGKNQALLNSVLRDKPTILKNKWEEDDKENQGVKVGSVGNEKMRSRSMIKQQITHKVRRNMAKSLDRKDDLLKLRVTFDSGKSRRLEEPNFGKLLSKFDCGVKTIWANEKPIDDLSGCDEDLPMDFQQLLDSPDTTASSDSLPFEFYKNVDTKQNAASSFIQCGTNITSSIWSEKADDVDASSDKHSFNGNRDVGSDLLHSFSVGSAWNNVKNENHTSGSGDLCDPWAFGEQICLDIPCKDVDFQMMDISLLKDSKWSTDVDDDDDDDVDVDEEEDFKTSEEFESCKKIIDISLSALNHNKEDSCFIEVVPTKAFHKGYKKCNERKPKLMYCWKQPGPVSGVSWDDDEDLLTSMRTHFQPITTKETFEVVEEKSAPSAPKYADGATFNISNSWDKPCFLRSNSGSYYLDSDPDQKYRDFIDDSLDTCDDFIPKFKVCQNEKFCQTDDVMISSDNEEFYFPDDGKHAKDFLEKDSVANRVTVDGWITAWPAGIWSNTPQPWCDVWSAEVSVVQKGGDHYVKLRDEILEEGEELLSDLSSMQHLFLANDETLPIAPTSQIESSFLCKTNSISLSSEMERKNNERNITLQIPLAENKRQHLASISSLAGRVVI